MEAEPPVLVAVDAFKGTLSASEVAGAVCRGLIGAGRTADPCPVADGGEGTLDALLTADDSPQVIEVDVSDPLGRPVAARVGLVEGGNVAVVETAEAIGLHHLADAERDPEIATSHGAGQLIAAAIATGAERIEVGVGGSATVDGGSGALEALAQADLPVGGAKGSPLIAVICDVRTSWEDAARVFGPQKGASPAGVKRLEARLQSLADGLTRDPRTRPMTGAAGGLSGALWAQYGAQLRPGGNFILDAVGFDRRMRASRSVITGEGRLDSTTLLGKAPGEVATRARQAGFGCAAVCGKNDLTAIEARILDLQVIIEAGDLVSLEAAGARLAELI